MQVMHIFLNSVVQALIVGNSLLRYKITFVYVLGEFINVLFINGLYVLKVALDGLESLFVVKHNVLGLT